MAKCSAAALTAQIYRFDVAACAEFGRQQLQLIS
jgi:hypothetical protein